MVEPEDLDGQRSPHRRIFSYSRAPSFIRHQGELARRRSTGRCRRNQLADLSRNLAQELGGEFPGAIARTDTREAPPWSCQNSSEDSSARLGAPAALRFSAVARAPISQLKKPSVRSP